MTNVEILAALQRGYDRVKGDGRTLGTDDDLVDDLDLDSLDAVDMLSASEDDFAHGVIDDVIDHMADIRSVGELVGALSTAIAHRAAAVAPPP